MGMQLSGSLELTGSLTTSGAIVAQTLVVQTITSSITQMTGSNIFGSSLTNRQQFTGSVTVTGSLVVSTTGTELQVNASGVTLGNSLTDSHVVSGSFRVNPNGLFVSGSGFVGVGAVTSSIGSRLVVSGSIESLTDSGGEGGQLTLRGNTFQYGIDNFNGTGVRIIRENDGTGAAGAALMFVSGSGFVGIGTTNPGYLLEVAGFTRTQNLRVTTDVYLERTGVSPAIVLDQSDIRIVNQSNGVSNTLSTISGAIQCNNGFFANVGTSAMGIGSIVNRRRVQWDDSLDEMMVLGSNNGYKAVGASAFNVRSDYRLKEDLKESNGLSEILKIKTYNFKWIDSEQRQDGFIAHELAEILPYVVTGEKDGVEDDGTMIAQGVDYSKIVPVLVKAIQELEARVKELENK